MNLEMNLAGFSAYKNPTVPGLRLPSIKIEKEFYEKYDLPSSASNFDFLKAICKRSMKELGFDKLTNSREYWDRATYELNTIHELGFVDYFLLNWEIINNCVEKGIPTGGGRGSAAGSLVLCLIGVTKVDPIKYGLYFERFISRSRFKKFVEDGVDYFNGKDSVDVDTDVSYERRKEVIDFIQKRYSGKTCKILTLSTLTGKLCLKECGKIVAELDEQTVNYFSDAIPKKFGRVAALAQAAQESEILKSFTKDYPRAFKIARKLEGLNKNTGVHPSGIAISYYELVDVMPVQKTGDGDLVSGYSMNDVSQLMVKFDILGLRTLSVVHDVCKLTNVDLRDIDISNPDIYANCENLNHPQGLFQIEADTNFRVCQKIKPNNLEELSAVIAIARPGALAFVDEYCDVKKGVKRIAERHPILDRILAQTNGTILYQESLMQCANQVFGLSLEDAEIIRRACSKKKKEDMEIWEPIIFQKARENGVPEEVAKFYWDTLIASADYSFNKCLHPSTSVKTKTGYDALSNIKVGDFVRGYDVKNQKNHYVKVLDVHSSEQELFEVKLLGVCVIKCSLEHKFLCADGIMRALRDVVRDKYLVLTSTGSHKLTLGKSLGICRTLDLEVDHSDHNFYANGIVVSNSHSISYAILAAQTIYFKFNHTKEFFLTLLRSTKFEPNPFEEISKIARELSFFDIRLLPPDLAKSGVDFEIEGSNIRYGLNSIKGVSTKVLESLIEFRQSSFSNKYEVFNAAKHCGLNIGTLSALIQAGTLDSFSEDRCRMVLEAQSFNLLSDREKIQFTNIGEQYNFDILLSVNDCVKNTIIGDDGKKIMTEKRFETFKKKYSTYRLIYDKNRAHIKFANWFFEKRLLGYSYSHTLRDIFKDGDGEKFISSLELKATSNDENVRVVGWVSNAEKRTSKNGNKYLKVDIQDELGVMSGMLMDAGRSSKMSAYYEDGGVTPKEESIVVLTGRKSENTIFLDKVFILDEKIYVKLSDLK